MSSPKSSSPAPPVPSGEVSKPGVTRALSALNPFARLTRNTLTRNRRKDFYQSSWDSINDGEQSHRGSQADVEKFAKETKEQGTSLLDLGDCDSQGDPDSPKSSPRSGSKTPKKSRLQRKRSLRRPRARSLPGPSQVMRKFSIK